MLACLCSRQRSVTAGCGPAPSTCFATHLPWVVSWSPWASVSGFEKWWNKAQGRGWAKLDLYFKLFITLKMEPLGDTAHCSGAAGECRPQKAIRCFPRKVQSEGSTAILSAGHSNGSGHLGQDWREDDNSSQSSMKITLHRFQMYAGQEWENELRQGGHGYVRK